MALPQIYTLKREFLEHLEIEKGRALNTIENYDRYLQRFLEQSEVEKPKDITNEIVQKFRLWLNRQPSGKTKHGREQTLKKKTQNYYLTALRQFLVYLAGRNVKSLAPERIELAQVGDRDLDLISSKELKTFLSAPRKELKKTENDRKRRVALRDIAILELLFSTGLRVSKLISLSRNTDFSRGKYLFGGKEKRCAPSLSQMRQKQQWKNILMYGQIRVTHYLSLTHIIVGRMIRIDSPLVRCSGS